MPTFPHDIQVFSCCQDYPCNTDKETGNTIFEAITLYPILGIIILSKTFLKKYKQRSFREEH